MQFLDLEGGRREGGAQRKRWKKGRHRVVLGFDSDSNKRIGKRRQVERTCRKTERV